MIRARSKTYLIYQKWAALQADRYAIYLYSFDVKVYHKVALGVADCPAVSFRFVYLNRVCRSTSLGGAKSSQSQVIFQVIHMKNNEYIIVFEKLRQLQRSCLSEGNYKTTHFLICVKSEARAELDPGREKNTAVTSNTTANLSTGHLLTVRRS